MTLRELLAHGGQRGSIQVAGAGENELAGIAALGPGTGAMKLRELLAKASPPRSGDELAGVVAMARAIRAEADGRRSADEGAGGVVRTAGERAR